MSKTYTVLVDDNLLSYSLSSSSGDGDGDGNAQWTTGRGNSDLFINGSTHDAASGGLTFGYSFYGKSLSWTGVLYETEDIAFSVSIDDGSPTSCNSRGGDEDFNIYKELCQSSFPNGQHSLSILCRGQDAESPVSIDYATYMVDTDDDVPPGLSPGMYILADDQDSGIVYSGNWVTDASTRYRYDGFSRFPYGSGTRRTNTVGDSLTYRFLGTSVMVYGIQLAGGSLSATLEVDGESRGTISINGGSGGQGGSEQSNKQLVSVSGLSADDHEMVLTVNEVNGGQSLIVDYILYEPLYDRSSDSSTSSTSSSPLPTSTNLSTGTDSPSKAWIAGLVFGLLALAALMAGLAFWWWKRKHRHKGHFDIDGAEYKGPLNPVVTERSMHNRSSSVRDAESLLASPWASSNDHHLDSDMAPANTALGMLLRSRARPDESPTQMYNVHGTLEDSKGKGTVIAPSPERELPVISQAMQLEKAGSRDIDSSQTTEAAIASQAAKLEELDMKRRRIALESSATSPIDEDRVGDLPLALSRRQNGRTRRSTRSLRLASTDSSITENDEEDEDVEELRKKNEMLQLEIARLSLLPPPAYESGPS